LKLKQPESPQEIKSPTEQKKKANPLEYSPTSTNDSAEFAAYQQRKIEEVLNMEMRLTE